MYRHAKRAGEDSNRRILKIIIAFLLVGTLLYPSFSRASSGTQTEIAWAWVNVKGTHVRKGPASKMPTLDFLRRGQLVIVLEKKGNWIDVQYELGKTGWIFKKNLSFGVPSKIAVADRILFIKDHVQGNKGTLEVYFNGKIDPKIYTFTIKNPSRLIVDVHGLKSARNKTYALNNFPLISKVKLGVHKDKSRYVLYLDKGIKKYTHSTLQQKNGVKFSLMLGTPSKSQAQKATPAPAVSSASKTVRITKTGFKDEKTRSIILLNISSRPTYYVRFKKGKVGLILNNTRIDKRYMRFFDTSGFSTPIKKVFFKNIIDTKTGRKAEVWVTIVKMVPYNIQVSNGVLEWIFKKPEEFIAKAGKVEKQNSQTMPLAKKKPVKVVASKPKRSVPASTNSNAGSTSKNSIFPKKKYTGTKMTFDFQSADIHNVLRLIAEVSNLNIVAGDDVRGKITLRLKNVPWDQALDIILQTKGLGKEQIGNVLRIAPIGKLKKEIQEQIASKKVKEKLEARVTEYIPVNYTTAKDLVPKIKPVLSSRGTVTIDERTNTLIIRDIPKKVKDVKSMVAKLDTPTPEVLIESRIVEAAKEFTREVGVKWGANYNAGPQYGNPPSPNFPNQMNVRGGANGQAGTVPAPMPGGVLPMVNLPAAASYGAIGVTLEQVVDIFTLDIQLTAMEDNGLGKVISSPRVATLDNKKATIKQGLKIPYLKITEEGTVTTDFIDANLNMEVTPHVSNDKMINMEIYVAKDTPDWTHLVQGVPSIDKKEAVTNVMVRDGGVTAIGGIFTIEKTNTVHKVPLFGDIPILGWAFKNKRTVKNRKELLIFISPKLIKLKGK